MIVYKVYEITKYAAFVSILTRVECMSKLSEAKLNSNFRIEVLLMSNEEFKVAKEAASEVNKATIAGWKKR